MSKFARPEQAAIGDDFEEDAGVADARSRFVGPVSMYAQKTGGNWEYLNDVPTVVGDATYNGAYYALSTEDLGRAHNIIITFENQANIAYDIEIVRHFEIIPSEEAAMETRCVPLSYKYNSALDIIRQYNISSLLSNPFAPSAISTTTTLWNLDHIYSA